MGLATAQESQKTLQEDPRSSGRDQDIRQKHSESSKQRIIITAYPEERTRHQASESQHRRGCRVACAHVFKSHLILRAQSMRHSCPAGIFACLALALTNCGRTTLCSLYYAAAAANFVIFPVIVITFFALELELKCPSQDFEFPSRNTRSNYCGATGV